MVRIQLGLDLTDEEIANVVAFLKSLTGKVPAEATRPTE
jgi:cytochrome c1